MCDPTGGLLTLGLIGGAGKIAQSLMPKPPAPQAPAILTPPQAAKSPDGSAVYGQVGNQGQAGISSTLLTGPGGAGPGNVGRATLLGQ